MDPEKPANLRVLADRLGAPDCERHSGSKFASWFRELLQAATWPDSRGVSGRARALLTLALPLGRFAENAKEKIAELRAVHLLGI